jgi:predicted N-acetyltransferase YhbS
MIEPLPIYEASPTAIELLLDAAFGTDRHLRTAYRLRQGSTPIEKLSFVLMDSDAPMACIQCWPVRIADTPLVLVGPVAVHPEQQNLGHGSHLMRLMLTVADSMKTPAMVMIGDPEYYGRFGFSADSTAGWEMPGPWEPRRLLARNPDSLTLPAAGMLERADAV